MKQEDDPSETQSSTPQVAHDMRDDSAAAAVDEIVSSVPTKQKRKRHRKKPLWAMTAEEVQQQEQQEDEDAADLIEFASSLDYEKCMFLPIVKNPDGCQILKIVKCKQHCECC